MVGLVTVIYFALKICKLRGLIANSRGSNEFRSLATRVFISGLIAVGSTLFFFIFVSAVPGFGRFLPMDSCFNSFAIIISFDMQYHGTMDPNAEQYRLPFNLSQY